MCFADYNKFSINIRRKWYARAHYQFTPFYGSQFSIRFGFNPRSISTPLSVRSLTLPHEQYAKRMWLANFIKVNCVDYRKLKCDIISILWADRLERAKDAQIGEAEER